MGRHPVSDVRSCPLHLVQLLGGCLLLLRREVVMALEADDDESVTVNGALISVAIISGLAFGLLLLLYLLLKVGARATCVVHVDMLRLIVAGTTTEMMRLCWVTFSAYIATVGRSR